VLVQAGAYGEHRFDSVRTDDDRETRLGGRLLEVILEPGCGTRLDFRMSRSVNTWKPTLQFPWNRD
jgi:hypothetical protein